MDSAYLSENDGKGKRLICDLFRLSVKENKLLRGFQKWQEEIGLEKKEIHLKWFYI